MVYHCCHQLVLVGERLQIDILGLLVRHLAFAYSESDVCTHGQTVLVLGDEYSIVQGLFGCELCVGMSADNEVEPRKALRHLDVALITNV